jgi:protocatechuate 3,4-dioxygenase, beta subunit
MTPPVNRTMPRLPGYRRPPEDTQPAYLEPRYHSTIKRAPTKPLILLPHTLSEIAGPVFGCDMLRPGDHDLTKQHDGEPIGEQIIVGGHVLDEDGNPVRNTLIEIWQANAAGRYRHAVDQHHAPLDPNFTGCGRTLTDANGFYTFTTIKPGAYPWRNPYSAWRPAHIHFSIFGPSFCTRLVTQMYFPGDPLLERDPMYLSIRSEEARSRLVASLDWEITIPELVLGYRFNIVLRGREATPFEGSAGDPR